VKLTNQARGKPRQPD